MANSQILYLGNGSTTLFPFTFPYLNTTDIKVTIDDVATTSYSFANATTISFTTAPANGAIVRIYRDTNNDNLTATFFPGSAIKSSDLNDNFTQSAYVTQEVTNYSLDRFNAVNAPMMSDLNLNTHSITNVVNATLSGELDAATLDISGNAEVDGTSTLATVDINAGNIDNTVIGAATPAAGTFSTVNATTITATDLNGNLIGTADLNGGTIDGTTIGGSTPASGAFTSASASSGFTGNVTGNLTGNVTGNVTGNLTGDVTGDITAASYSGTGIVTSGLSNSDTQVYSAKRSDEIYFNKSSVDEIASGETWQSNDDTVATTAAIDARIIDLVDDVGGFVPLANEYSFPATNPDINNGPGTLLSVPLVNSHIVGSSGRIIIWNAIPGGGSSSSYVIITDAGPSGTTYEAGFGIIVETTSTLRTYKFHRYVPKATEVTTVASNITPITTVSNNISNVNTVAGIDSDVTAVAGITSNIATIVTNLTDVQNAGTNATNAAASAATASTQATNAANSASTASTQATNAASSATAASNSASAANTSASNAATSATSATNSASSSQSSASAAATDAASANTSATAAGNSASAASTSASNAATSATNAANSATAAATSATNAANSATAAATSATTATTQASNASTSASTAATQASNAASSATAAANSATSASGFATTTQADVAVVAGLAARAESDPYNINSNTDFGSITSTVSNSFNNELSTTTQLTMSIGSSSFNYGTV